MKRRQRWSVVALSLILVVSGASLGVIATFLFTQESVPPSLASPAQPISVVTTAQPYADPREVSVTVVREPSIAMRIGRGGIVTSFNCVAGRAWTSGTANISVDGLPIVNLHSSVPLWREIEVGAEGSDVTSLKAELARLGHQVTESAAFGRTDLSSFREVLKGAGVSGDQVSAVDPTQVLWLSAVEVDPSKCVTTVGAQISKNDTVADAATSVHVQVDNPPSDLRAGPRQMKVDQITLPLNADLTLANPTDAAGLLLSPTFRSATADSTDPTQPVTLTAAIELLTPIDAVPLPPSAVTISSGSQGCVEDDAGAQHKVVIVSSELGRTVVVFDSAVPARIAISGPSQCE